jgi:hypothetical protein
MQTLWSWTLHTLCFLPFYPSKLWTLLTYGPSAGGAWALMVMWMWTMIANPGMEYQLSPKVYQITHTCLHPCIHATPPLYDKIARTYTIHTYTHASTTCALALRF